MNKTNNHLSLQLAEHQKRPRHMMCVLVWDRHEHHCPELDLRRCATQLFSAKQVCCCIYLNSTGSNIGAIGSTGIMPGPPLSVVSTHNYFLISISIMHTVLI